MTLYYFDGYPVDAILESDDTAESEVTEFEVEDGEAFGDHIRNRPREVSFTIVVSNSPLAAVQTARGSTINGLSYVEEALAFFEAIRDNRLPITIEAPLRVYDSMALTSLGEPQSVEDGDSQRFSVSFRHLRTTKSARAIVTLPRAAAPRRKGVVGNETGKYVIGFNPKTGKSAYYFPDSGKWYNPDLSPIADPSGYDKLHFDPASKRWLNDNGQIEQQIPPSYDGYLAPYRPSPASTPSHSITGPTAPLALGDDGRYDPFWDPQGGSFLGFTK